MGDNTDLKGSDKKQRIGRRAFLRNAAVLGLSVGVGPTLLSEQGLKNLVPDRGPVSRIQAPTVINATAEIGFAWWGEEEAPGLRGWVAETIDLFQKQNLNIKVENIEWSGDAVMPAFQTAVAAKSGPDILFAWDNAYFLEATWSGAFAPLGDLLKDDLPHIPQRARSWGSWEGKDYAVPFYSIPTWLIYNKDMYKEAGADPENPPKTFAEWVALGKEVKKKGHTFYGLGVKDDWAADWIWITWAFSNMTSQYEWLECWLGLNGKNMQHEAAAGWWAHQKEIVDAGFLPDDVQSIGLYEGMDYFVQGKAATVTSNYPKIKLYAKQMGADKIGHHFLAPTWGNRGTVKDDVNLDCSVFAIADWSPHKEEAAKLLAFMRTPERQKALYEKAAAMMLDDRFDPSWLQAQWEKDLLQLTLKGKQWSAWAISSPNFHDFTVANFSGLYTGKMTPEQAADKAAAVVKEYADKNPEMTQRFIKWSENFKP